MYELLTAGGEDDKGVWFSYLCPQSCIEMCVGWRTLSVPQVAMRKFYLDCLAPQLVPRGCWLDFETEAERLAELVAVFYGLERYLRWVGCELPVTVQTSASWVVEQLEGNGGFLPDCLSAWRNAVFNVKWLGVRFRCADPSYIGENLG